MESVQPAAPAGAILQLKVRLLGISPMIWRRVLVPESVSLRELDGVLQLAMGWEGIHLFEFAVRGVRYAGPGLSGLSTDVVLSDFRFRRNAKFRYAYDMFCGWEHEIRVEQRLAAVPDKRYPQCVGGAGACRADSSRCGRSAQPSTIVYNAKQYRRSSARCYWYAIPRYRRTALLAVPCQGRRRRRPSRP